MSTDNQSAQSALDEIKRVCIELERAYAGKDYSRQALFRACGLLGELADSIALAQAPAPSGETTEPPKAEPQPKEDAWPGPAVHGPDGSVVYPWKQLMGWD